MSDIGFFRSFFTLPDGFSTMLNMRIRLFACLAFILTASACRGIDRQVVAPEPLEIDRIESTLESIESGNPLPPFMQFFDEGTTAINSYVWLRNSKTMTGSYPVRMRWFSPNDFRPPIAQSVVEMEPGQQIAQFSIHNESGLTNGPYQLFVRAGKDLSNLSASGSKRFFVGMTPEQAQDFMNQETAFRKKRDEKRAKRAAEEARARAGSGTVTGSGADLGGSGHLPPALAGEAEE